MPGPLLAAAIPAAIAGGTQLLGGLLQKKPKIQYDYEEKRKQYSELRRAAEKGGFNPLTVLRAGGGGSLQGNIMTPLNPLGDAIANAGATFAANYNPMQHESQVLDNELRRQQIESLKGQNARASTVSPVRTASAPIKTGSTADSWNPDDLTFREPTAFQDQTKSANPTVDPSSVRPEDARVKWGPLKGRYIIKYAGDHYALPSATPQAVYEETLGSLAGEFTGGTNALDALTGKNKVYVDANGGVSKSPPVRPFGQNILSRDKSNRTNNNPDPFLDQGNGFSSTRPQGY